MTKTIFSLKLAHKLIAQGFKVKDCALNHINSEKIVFHFDVTDELSNEFDELVNNYKNKKK
jgi:hypothetical protein